MIENRREFFRVSFDQSIGGEISTEDGNSWSIDIDDISVKGLKFLASQDIPMDKKIKAVFAISEQTFLVEGSIVRKEGQTHWFEYGVAFVLDQAMASLLFQELNYFQIRQKKGQHVN